MKKVTKNKQNWFKLKFKKHPYLFTFLIGWPILFFTWLFLFILLDYYEVLNKDAALIRVKGIDVLAIIYLLLPFIIFFLWLRKKSSKIKSFYKSKKKTFKKIYYSFGTIFALGAIYLIAVIISIGGITNFKERVEFEYGFWSYKLDSPVNNVCDWAGSGFYPVGMGEFIDEYEFRWWTQFFDYFEEKESTYLSSSDIKKGISFLPFYKGDPETQIKIARFYRNTIYKIYNPCKSSRYLLRAAHQGNKTAQEMLAASFFGYPSRYDKIEKVKDMNLKNPALAYKYAQLLDNEFKNPEALKYLKFSSDAGYLMANEDLLDIYMDNFKKSDCKSIIEIRNYLAEQKSFIIFHSELFVNMGRIYSDEQKIESTT